LGWKKRRRAKSAAGEEKRGPTRNRGDAPREGYWTEKKRGLGRKKALHKAKKTTEGEDLKGQKSQKRLMGQIRKRSERDYSGSLKKKASDTKNLP